MEITLSSGHTAIVDDIDFPDLGRFKWNIAACAYAARSVVENGKRKMIYMHRQLMDAKAGQIVDHINGNTFDNRRSNLRFVTKGQNNSNRQKRISKTGYLGVRETAEGRYQAFHCINGKFIHIGNFDKPDEAAMHRDDFIVANGLIYANLNFRLPLSRGNSAEGETKPKLILQ